MQSERTTDSKEEAFDLIKRHGSVVFFYEKKKLSGLASNLKRQSRRKFYQVLERVDGLG